MKLPRSAWLDQNEVTRERLRYCSVDSQAVAVLNGGRGLDYFRGKKILLWTRKPGMGDMVMNAICCDVLRRYHGLDVTFGCRGNFYDCEFPAFLDNIPCYTYQPNLREFPLPDQVGPRGYEGGVDYTGAKIPFDFVLDFRYQIHEPVNTLFQCLREFGVERLETPCEGLPVRNLPNVERPYDVVLSPHCGGWRPLRAYRHGDDLASLLRERGLSVLNVSDRLSDPTFRLSSMLAEVREAKLFIGVESGATHLVSGVHKQAIILQAGIHRSAFWNVYARTHVIEADWTCGGRKCRVRSHENCVVPDGVCIDRFAPEDVMELAIELLDRR